LTVTQKFRVKCDFRGDRSGIDIHTVENGRIRRVHHLEEWMAALAQLKG